MTTARAVPTTRDEQHEGDDAFETLRAAGRRRLLVDAVARFRPAHGFSHSRARLPDDPHAAAGADRAVGATAALRQGTASARQETGETAVAAGFVAAVLAGTGAMARVERGANRI